MAPPTFESLFGGGIDPLLKRMVLLSALMHVTIAGLLLVLARSAPLPVSYRPAIHVALVDLPEVTELKDVKLGAPKPKELPAAERKKPTPEKAEKPKPEPAPKKKVVALKEEKKTDKKATVSKRKEEASQRARMESAVDRLRRESVAVSKIRQRALDTAAPEGTPGGNVRGVGAFRTVAYDAQLLAILKENWELPSTFLGQPLSTVVSMKIDRLGRIVEWRIVSSSGNPVFDDTVYRAMMKTQAGHEIPVPEPDVYELIKEGYRIDFNPKDFFSGEMG
jgi:outer membrane biosynthesis protein TonB